MSEPQHPATHGRVEGPARPAPESFGDPRVDSAVARLADLDERPVADHVEVFDDIHARFRDALEDAAGDGVADGD